MKKVSIIVPVYNVEEYIEKCLSSLVNQTLRDIEIIIVNDGSPDNSQLIIDQFQKKYPDKIKSYTKKNGGLSSARNFGIKKATGEYIAFLDSDDYVDLKTYEILYNKALETSSDMVFSNLYYVYDDYIKKFSVGKYNEKINTSQLFIDMYPVSWNKIFKKSLFTEQVKFKEGIWFEDVEFLYKVLPFIKKVSFVDEYLFYYVQREGSITNKYDERIWNYIDNLNGIIDFYTNNNLYRKYKKELEYVYVRYIFGTFLKQIARSNDKQILLQAYSEAKKQIKYNFPAYRMNLYFYKSFKGFYLLTINKCYLKFLLKVN